MTTVPYHIHTFPTATVAEAIAGTRDDVALSPLSISGWAAGTLPYVTPQMYGAVGDGVTDDTAAIASMLTSPDTRIDWGNVDKIYRVTSMLTEARPFAAWYGSATIKLDRAGLNICPLLNVTSAATGFYCAETLTFDHNASGISVPDLANQPAFVLCCCVLLQAPGFDFSCRVLNSFDNGVAVVRGTWTGDGAATPYTFTQVNAQPQSWRIGYVYGENCGCGVHGGQFGEEGQKGAVVNILTGSDGAVTTVVGKSNYNGFIVDFGGGAECVVGELAFTGTLLDGSFPFNGSGIDCVIGAGPVSISKLRSDNAGRCGLALTQYASSVSVDADIHAAGENGVIISGGRVIGNLRVTNSSLSSAGAYDAVLVAATAADIDMLINVMCDGDTYHRYAYASSQSGGFFARGMVRLDPGRTVTGPVSRGGEEAISAGTTGDNMTGPLSIGYAAAALNIDKVSGNDSFLNFRTGTSFRWRVGSESTAESGSNAGSSFRIHRYNDAGVYIDTPISISRSTGLTAVGALNSNNTLRAWVGTAIPAGGTAGSGLLFSSATNFGVFFGSGAPSLSAAKGSLYLRSDGTGTTDRMYVNTNGTTTWTAVTTVA